MVRFEVWAAIGLAFGLAMDATAISVARGLARKRPREVVILPVLFGVFQSGMAALGWLAGDWGGAYLARWDHWIAFGLLVGIGAKMILDALRRSEEHEERAGVVVYLALAIATSIDAAAAGLTLPLVPVEPWLAIALIGGVTAVCSAIGYLLGNAAGRRFGSWLEFLGGGVLIAIGIVILVEHL